MLYKFERLITKLDQLGYPAISEGRRMRIMRKDLTQEERAGNLKFEDDGIYLTVDGNTYKGYMYIKYPDINRNGYPKFHISNCSVIQEFKARNLFDHKYYWHNSNTVDLQDRVTHVLHSGVKLELCYNCKKASRITYKDTVGFFDQFDVKLIAEEKVETDLFGYRMDWEKISREYRNLKSYKCEHCGIQMHEPMDHRYIHVHHKNGNKLDNKILNLQCKCILCHAHSDGHHRKQFSKKGMKRELENFIEKFKVELERLSNPYLGK